MAPCPTVSPATRSPTWPGWPTWTLTDDELDAVHRSAGGGARPRGRRRGARRGRRRADRPPLPAGQRAGATTWSGPTLDRDEVLAQAPDAADGRFRGAGHPGRGAVSRPGADRRRGRAARRWARRWRSPRPSRAGERSAREVVDAHLSRIAEAEDDVHAFNLVLADQARAAADELDRRGGGRRRPRARWPACPSPSRTTSAPAGVPTTCSSRILDGWRPPYDATVVAAAGGRRRHRHRQDQPRRVRHGQLDRELGVRSDPQPPRPRRGCRAARRGAARRRWPRASRRWRSAPTPAARSASPPPCAAWSGSSPPTAWCRATA